MCMYVVITRMNQNYDSMSCLIENMIFIASENRPTKQSEGKK